MEQVRSFIAIELPNEVKQLLAQLQAKLKSGGQFPVKWVDPYNIHLTIKFLGNVGVDRIDGIVRAIEQAARGISPFHLEVKGLGVFPNSKRVQVAWVGVSGDLDRLGQLQKHIESNLTPLGFTPESRSFTPHLTIARLRDRASIDEQSSFGQLITATRFEASYSFSVDFVKLMRSQLTSDGPVYSQICSAGLKKNLSTTDT
ncbi:RNA 2',3'-cyclic phosphodiesterase [Chloroflexota bacterium]